MNLNQHHSPARYWESLEETLIQCNVCPRYCKLRTGKRGFCFVRQNIDNKLVLTTYGKSSGFCIDPIEKKPLNHFYPGTSVLSFGTAGCNLGCRFCQNWDISKAQEMDKLMDSASPEKIAKVAKKLNCHSVAFTYNDPVIFLEYAVDIAKECKRNGIKTVAVSAGYITKEARNEFYSVMDATNIDLKAFTQTFYKKLCFANLEPILDTLIYLKNETNVWFEITNLIIPNQNDAIDELKQMCNWVLENLGPHIPIHFSAFHPDFKMLDTPPTPPETLINARQIALDLGLKYVYTGNVHHVEGDTTFCSSCNTPIIERDWYEIGTFKLKNGSCPKCKTPLHGQFNKTPGNWGRKRLPINLENFDV